MFKFCIGKPEGLRSTVWKVWIHKRNVYLQSRMMGCEAKISFHESGQIQWSLTDEWVKHTGAKNIERHLYRWKIQQLADTEMIFVFRIIFPESELQQVGNPRKNSQIYWINPPQQEYAKVVECYISTIHGEVLKTTIVSSDHLASLPLDMSRYFVPLIRDEPIKKEIKKIILDNKKSNTSYVGSTAVELSPKNRAVILIIKPVPEMIELNARGKSLVY